MLPMIPHLVRHHRLATIKSAVVGFALSLAYGGDGHHIRQSGCCRRFDRYAPFRCLAKSFLVLGSFALIFVALSFSMFGFYELQLPTALQSKLSDEAGHLQGGRGVGVS